MASAYSVRPTPDARVSAPLAWDELDDVRAGGLHAAHHAGAVCANAAIAHAGIDEHGGLARGAARAVGTAGGRRGWATRRGRRTIASKPVSRRASRRRGGRQRPQHERRCRELPAAHHVAKAAREADALAGLERWKARHPEAAALLAPADVLVDAMRGRFDHLDPHAGQPRARARARAARAGGARSARLTARVAIAAPSAARLTSRRGAEDASSSQPRRT